MLTSEEFDQTVRPELMIVRAMLTQGPNDPPK